MDKYNPGLIRRLLPNVAFSFEPREGNKTVKTFYETLEYYANYFSDYKPRNGSKYDFVIWCSTSLSKQIVKLPEAYRRGRWTYIKYNGKVFFVKEVKI